MALGLNTTSNGGDFLPICTWDARAGRFFRVDREQNSDSSWSSVKVDMTSDNPTFLMDMRSIEVGYLAFTATGPAFDLVPFGQPMPAKASAEHKAGMRVKLYSPKFFGEKPREFAASAKSVLGAIDALHTAYQTAPEAAQGKLPVVQLKGSTMIVTKGPNGTVTSYAPTFTVTGWSERPAILGDATVAIPEAGRAAPAAPAAPAPAPAASRHVPPPKSKPETRDSDFNDTTMPF